eukprot:5920784-Pleurochrysis_carterae.AAC.5
MTQQSRRRVSAGRTARREWGGKGGAEERLDRRGKEVSGEQFVSSTIVKSATDSSASSDAMAMMAFRSGPWSRARAVGRSQCAISSPCGPVSLKPRSKGLRNQGNCVFARLPCAGTESGVLCAVDRTCLHE